jgi:hypothetical protein
MARKRTPISPNAPDIFHINALKLRPNMLKSLIDKLRMPSSIKSYFLKNLFASLVRKALMHFTAYLSFNNLILSLFPLLM